MNGITSCAIGALGRDAEIKYTQQGEPLLSFSIAVASKRANEKGPPEWLKVTAWGDQAETLNASGNLGKGAEVYVEGRLTLNEWTTPDGQKRAGLNLSAYRVDVLGAIGRRAKTVSPLFGVGEPSDAGGHEEAGR